ncbi:MAG: hypothetical protein WKH64_02635 [Chloroflexia bacterium]
MDEALESAHRATNLAPDDADAVSELAAAREALGEHTAALALYKQAALLAPTDVARRKVGSSARAPVASPKPRSRLRRPPPAPRDAQTLHELGCCTARRGDVRTPTLHPSRRRRCNRRTPSISSRWAPRSAGCEPPGRRRAASPASSTRLPLRRWRRRSQLRPTTPSGAMSSV